MKNSKREAAYRVRFKGERKRDRYLTGTAPPFEQEGRRNDRRLRENFIVRIFCYQRWQRFKSKPFRLAGLIEFHARHKFLLLAHHEENYRALGRLVAAAKMIPPKDLLLQYESLFFATLRVHATTRKHANVLRHLAGYFKKQLSAGESQELHATIAAYQRGLLPLIVPITLIKHYVNTFAIEYLQHQVYLNPHPMELLLLNRV